ncbi:hypothetical protein LCGC14_2184750, partial [marine sediment metagenome]
DIMAGVLTSQGLIVGDSEPIEIGVGGLTGALGADSKLYSDGTVTILQIESPTGLSADFTNPKLGFTYFDIDKATPSLLYVPLITSPRGTLPDVIGVSHTLIAYDKAEVVGGAFHVAKPGDPQTVGVFLYDSGTDTIILGDPVGGLDFRLAATGGDVKIEADTFTIDATAYLKEHAAADTDKAGYGQLWTKDNAGTTELWFTDDSGTDTKIV